MYIYPFEGTFEDDAFPFFFQVRYVTRVDENDMIRNDSFSTRGATNEGGDGDSCQGAEFVGRFR